MSEVCEAFGCPPDVAERQNYGLVSAILDYRAAMRAREVFNQPNKRQAFDQLRANPRLLEILALMRRAQAGQSLDGVSGLAREGEDVARSYRSAQDEADGDAE